MLLVCTCYLYVHVLERYSYIYTVCTCVFIICYSYAARMYSNDTRIYHWQIQDFTKDGGGGTGKQFMIVCITKDWIKYIPVDIDL